MPTVNTSKLRLSFFDFLFDEQAGYVCIAFADKGEPGVMKSSFRQSFFRWPNQRPELGSFLDQLVGNKHLWFGVNLFDKPLRRTEYAKSGRLIYADLDACSPDIVTPTPSVAIETSPGRFHALWRSDQTIDPDIAAEYSRRIAYRYSVNGADRSGWDVTQLLRVPYTHNFKYPGYPEIKVVQTLPDLVSVSEFEAIEVPEELRSTNGAETDDDVPDIKNLPNAEWVVYKYLNDSNMEHRNTIKYWMTEPEETDDWSGIMWRMINTFIEEGASPEETFAMALSAKCNKYERDKRPIRLLWREIKKAFIVNKSIQVAVNEHSLLRLPDIGIEPHSETFLTKYIQWATESTDAVPIFHELCGFIILSALLSSTVRLPVQYGTLVPNLWGLVLGESTLTRKTTAMTLATNIIGTIDREVITASDGSVEGLLQSLVSRPSMASIFYRDEITGFFDAINRKDYLAGMSETLTHLYDVPNVFRRVLRKDTIIIETPILIFFGGGIRDKVYSLLNEEYVLSGFLPRFLVVSGNTDLDRIRPTGPPTDVNLNERLKIVETLQDLYNTYNAPRQAKIGSQVIMRQPTYKAQLTSDAWTRYQDIENKLQLAANSSHISDLALPTFERLSRSLLKMATLLGATRQEPVDDKFEVSEGDIQNAAYYIQRFAPSSIDMIYNAGKTTDLRMMDRIREYIIRNAGLYRSDLMRNFHLNKRQMDLLVETLVDRGDIRVTRAGKGLQYWPM